MQDLYLFVEIEDLVDRLNQIFPFLSGKGQRGVISQILELCPTNKIMWSSEIIPYTVFPIKYLLIAASSADGHFFPETYYLATIQAREALYDVRTALLHISINAVLILRRLQVLSEHIAAKEFTEGQATLIAENALFHNANRLYKLRLQPILPTQ